MYKSMAGMTLTVDYDKATFECVGGFRQVIIKPPSVSIIEWEHFWEKRMARPEEHHTKDTFTHEEALKRHKEHFNQS